MNRVLFLLLTVVVSLPAASSAQGRGARSLAGCYKLTFSEVQVARDDVTPITGETILELTLERRPHFASEFEAYAVRHRGGLSLSRWAPSVEPIWVTAADSSTSFVITQGDSFYGFSMRFVPADSVWRATLSRYSDARLEPADSVRDNPTHTRVSARRIVCLGSREGS
jgi:hypothetical protein